MQYHDIEIEMNTYLDYNRDVFRKKNDWTADNVLAVEYRKPPTLIVRMGGFRIRKGIFIECLVTVYSFTIFSNVIQLGTSIKS